MSLPLAGRIALVAGATRGAGRGIAVSLGELGATVIGTGRSSRAAPIERAPDADPFTLEGRPETIEQTAERVDAAGGRGIAIRCDHTDEAQVAALMARIADEHGRLDLLVNDIWGGDGLMDWGGVDAFDVANARLALDRGLWTHVITARHALPLLKQSDRPLVVEITDGDDGHYRGNLPYDLIKHGVIRLAFALSEAVEELTAVAVSPGFLRSEAMLEHFGLTEESWRDGAEKDPHFAASESPHFVGRGVAALAADPGVARWSGKVTSSWALARVYDLVDVDGRRPDWGAHRQSEAFGADQRAGHARFLAAFDPP